MGYVLTPIPKSVWDSLTPAQRMELYQMERARLMSISHRQGGMAACAGVTIVIGALLLLFTWAAGLL